MYLSLFQCAGDQSSSMADLGWR